MNKLTVVLMLTLVGCTDSTNIINTLPPTNSTNDTSIVLDEFVSGIQMSDSIRYKSLRNAVYKGDTSAFNEVATFYIFNGRGPEFLFYSMMMANKYNYANAYFCVYLILVEYLPLETSGNRTKSLAYFYLLKAYEMGNRNAFYKVREVFGKGKIPKSAKYKNLE